MADCARTIPAPWTISLDCGLHRSAVSRPPIPSRSIRMAPSTPGWSEKTLQARPLTAIPDEPGSVAGHLLGLRPTSRPTRPHPESPAAQFRFGPGCGPRRCQTSRKTVTSPTPRPSARVHRIVQRFSRALAFGVRRHHQTAQLTKYPAVTAVSAAGALPVGAGSTAQTPAPPSATHPPPWAIPHRAACRVPRATEPCP